MGLACEQLHDRLCAKWHTTDSVAAWTPKCDVVLHPNDASYLREVGRRVSTVASSLIDQKEGVISLRRVDVRSQKSNWQSAALPHELTHVILADCFGGRVVPRWIDEGAALLADPAEKRLRHKAEMDQAIADRLAFRVVELMTLEDYPADNRWGAFYGQSLSLVEYLTEQRSSDEFIRFVQLSFDKGYDASLREVYGLADVNALERHWKTRADLPATAAIGRNERVGVVLADFSPGASTRISPINSRKRKGLGLFAPALFVFLTGNVRGPNSLLKKALVAFFNLAKRKAKLRAARKIMTYAIILSSHSCDVAAS